MLAWEAHRRWGCLGLRRGRMDVYKGPRWLRGVGHPYLQGGVSSPVCSCLEHPLGTSWRQTQAPIRSQHSCPQAPLGKVFSTLTLIMLSSTLKR